MDTFSALQPSYGQSEEEKKRKEEEAMFDKFAILFSPPTPRASPTPEASSDDIWKPSSRPTEYHEPPTSPDSEFGSFVSVPASEDPLASFPSLGDMSSPSGPSQSPSRPRHTHNASLDFFDKFGREAKKRDRRGYLDELLLHEDDPLYWLKDGKNDAAQRRPKPETNTRETGDASAPLIDLDFGSQTPESSKPAHSTRAANVSSPTRSPTRSTTLSLPHTLAPPVASISSASSSPSLPSTPDPSTETRPPLPARSSSYQTLSSISSRWMSSLAAPKNSTSQPSTLESLFTPSFVSHTRSSTVPTQTIHETPFSGPTHHSSPFAPHVFVPTSGAPGFKGDSYDWDKGFSQQLDKELTESELLETTKQSNGSDHTSPSIQSQESLVSGLTRPTTPSQGIATIGSFIEKKTGGIELRGRREATVGVLDAVLADKIRTHLPALARLPRTWNLLYSLDQHGISLNTLYTKCEAQPNVRSGSNIVTKVGALVVMKDSNDTIFGAYVGDGVHKGRGYYGSGESFLWRHDRGNLMVFRWTGKNEYVALCEPDYISFGGGDGAYGLYLDESLFDGSSARCPTFDNEPLCSSGPRKGRSVTFECVGLEVWGIGP